MAQLSAIYGFSIDRRFRLGDKKYRIGAGGVRALKLLAHISHQTPHCGDIAWLLPFRSLVREIERLNPRAVLSHVVRNTDDDHLRCLAIWLRGRCGGTLGTSAVARYSNSSNRALRKEATRCLRKMSAWQVLRRIAAKDDDPRIRQMATQSASKPYTTRLAEYSQRISRHPGSRRKPLLVVSLALDAGRGRPPKSRSMIRAVLERIHQLVNP